VQPGDTDLIMAERRARIVNKMLGKPTSSRTIREFKDPMFPYKLMRLKMMISFHSCEKDVSLKELFLSSILNTHEVFYGKQNYSQVSISDLSKNRLAQSSTFNSKELGKNKIKAPFEAILQTEEELNYESRDASPFELRSKNINKPNDPGTFTLALNKQLKKETDHLEPSNSVVVLSEEIIESDSRGTSTIIHNKNRRVLTDQDTHKFKSQKVKERLQDYIKERAQEMQQIEEERREDSSEE